MRAAKIGCLSSIGLLFFAFFVACSVNMISGAASSPRAPELSRPATPATSPTTTAQSPAPLPAAAPTPTDDPEAITDAAFLLSLDNDHITYSSPDAAIAEAHAICNQFDAGANWGQVVGAMVEGAQGSYTPAQIGFIMGASVQGYCPQHDADIPSGN